MEAWDTFAVITGGAAALTGLLFVAVSIRIDYITRSQELRNRAAQTLSLFGTVLIIAALIAIPGQSYRTLGIELLVLAVITGAGLYVLDRRAKARTSNQAIGRWLDVVAPNTVTSLLLLAAGIFLVAGAHAGLYVLVAPVLVALVGGIASTWLFLTKITNSMTSSTTGSSTAHDLGAPEGLDPNLLIRRYLSAVQDRPDRPVGWGDRQPPVRARSHGGLGRSTGWLPGWLPACRLERTPGAALFACL